MTAQGLSTARKVLGVAPLHRCGAIAPLLARVIAGTIMACHGLDKLLHGPAGFGALLTNLGVPAPLVMAWVVALLETIGGALLVLGLLSRLTAAMLTVQLCFAIALVNINIGFLSPRGSGAGVEFPLSLIASYLVVLLAGPGVYSLDRLLGIERDPASRLLDADAGQSIRHGRQVKAAATVPDTAPES